MIILPNPPGTDKFLVNSSTPILAPKRPATVIKSNFNLPTRELITEGTDINGFVIQDCILTVKSFEVANTRCGGNLCDRQGENSSRCACFQMTSRSGNVVVSIEVEITNPNGSTFTTMIQSKWFLEQYLLTAPLPAGTRASKFEDFEVEDIFFASIRNVINYINTSCGFRVIGWVKRGEVQDQGAEQPTSTYGNPPRVMIQSGSLTHHVTTLDPMVPERIDLDHLASLKFDVLNDFNN